MNTTLDRILSVFGIYRYVPMEITAGHWIDRVTKTHFDNLPDGALLIDATDNTLNRHPVGDRVRKGNDPLDLTTTDNVLQYGFPNLGNRTASYWGGFRVWDID